LVPILDEKQAQPLLWLRESRVDHYLGKRLMNGFQPASQKDRRGMQG
jgi:hypothetical protein